MFKLSMYFNLLFTLGKRCNPFIWISLNSPDPGKQVCEVWLKLAQWVGKKCVLSLLRKRLVPLFYQTWIPFTHGSVCFVWFCFVWLTLVLWSWRGRFLNFNVFSLFCIMYSNRCVLSLSFIPPPPPFKGPPPFYWNRHLVVFF